MASRVLRYDVIFFYEKCKLSPMGDCTYIPLLSYSLDDVTALSCLSSKNKEARHGRYGVFESPFRELETFCSPPSEWLQPYYSFNIDKTTSKNCVTPSPVPPSVLLKLFLLNTFFKGVKLDLPPSTPYRFILVAPLPHN